MRIRSGRVLVAGVVAAAVLAVLPPAGSPPAAAQDQGSAEAARAHDQIDERRLRADARVAEQARRGQFPEGRTRVGTVRSWPALDTRDESWYLKDFTLRGLSPHMEVWVASGADAVSSGLQFPHGDCRNGDPRRTTVTDAQITELIEEFEQSIRPSQAAVFPLPISADGKDALLPRLVPRIPSSAYRGDGDRVVLLVDNIRQPAFADPAERGGTLGFVLRYFNVLTGRNVLTVQGTSWAWRLGADPIASVEGEGVCRDIRRAPRSTEALLAHEYNHVIAVSHGNALVTGESAWVLEGIADWAMELAGYVDPQTGGLSPLAHIGCFLGHTCDGPENSLTTWGETPWIGADYGAAAHLMTFAHGRLGDAFIRDLLIRSDVHGMDKLRLLLGQHGHVGGVEQLLTDWAASVALDGPLDAGTALSGQDPARYAAPFARGPVNWDAPGSHERPGAPPNGSDFVRLRDAAGGWLQASQLDSLHLDGGLHVVAEPVEWVVDPNGHGPGDAALASGAADHIDRSIVVAVDVPVEDPTLTFDLHHDLEPGWDFAFVQVSTDGGATYRSLSSPRTTAEHDPQADPRVTAHLPGYTGTSGGWVQDTIDLSDHAGRTIHLAFRTITDAFVTGPGISVDDVVVGGVALTDGSTLEGWRTMTQLRSDPVHHLALQLVGYTSDHTVASVASVPLDAGNDATLDAADLAGLVAPGADVVAAVVTYVEPTGTGLAHAGYELRVNGVVQPGGS